jgi:tetratricopeptide (TPR) repeat protein
LNPSNPAAYLNRGILRLRQHDADGALADFNRAIKLGGDTTDNRLKRAHALADRKEFAKALKEYNLILSRDPYLAEAHYARGNVFEELGKLDQALVDYDEAIRLEPTQTVTYMNRAVVYHLKGDLDKAIAGYNEAIRLGHPRIENAFHNRGVAYTALGRYSEAISDFDEAIRRNADFVDAYCDRARARSALGLSEEAFKDLETAERLGPNDAKTCNSLAWIFAAAFDPHLRDGQRAIRLATKACELAQWKNPSFLDTLAAAYAEAGKFADAIRTQEKALALPSLNDATAAGMRKRLALYQQNTAYHEPH